MDQVNSTPSAAVSHENDRLFPSDGEMARLMHITEWSTNLLGPVEQWPQSLRTAAGICLHSRFPIVIFWGPELALLYNDAYLPMLGDKHPQSLGQRGMECWSEIWHIIGPMLKGVLDEGVATWSNDQLLLLNRKGYFEEAYFTFSYSPIYGEHGGVDGVFCAVTETTHRVLSERRATAARELAAVVVCAPTTEEVCVQTMRALAKEPNAVPFALLYLLDHDGRYAHLAACSGLTAGENPSFAPKDIDLAADDAPDDTFRWPLREAARSGQREVVTDLPRWPGVISAPAAMGALALPPRAVALPVVEPGQAAPSAILVVGVNPHLALDDDYERFHELLASHLASALASAHAYEEERKRADALAAIDRAKTAFFSNISHEFRTPLTLLLGPLEDMLKDTEQPLAPIQRQRLEVMNRNGLRLLKLVNSLLDFARIEAGRTQASYEPTDLSAYTAELASAFRSLIERAGMRLIVDCPPLEGAISAPVYVDRDMWEKMVFNLLSNAFKYTFAGSITVSLRAGDGGAAVELAVRDTGVGIPADELPQLFERFHRVEGVRARTHEGSGIGLALVQELVHLHGGAIRAESVEGAGTSFCVRLPTGVEHLPADRVRASRTLVSTSLGAAPYLEEAWRWLPEATDASDASDTPAAASSDATDDFALSGTLAPQASDARHRRPAHIVLADDNADMRDYLKRLLATRYIVETAANGVQALELIRRQRPDLALVDVMMPELDGFGLLRAVRADPQTAHLPVMLLSARAGEEATVEGLEAGADDYLIKPFSAREVLSRVAARLEIARAWADAERHTHAALTALLEMAATIVTAPEDGSETPTPAREVVIDRVLHLAQGVFAGQYVGAAILDFAEDSIEPLGTVGLPQEQAAKWWNGMQAIPLSGFVPAELAAQLRREEILELDLSGQPPIPGQDYFGIQRVLAVGRNLADGRFSVITIERRGAVVFSPQDRNLARAAIGLVALVIEREQLTREREGARAEAHALAETTRRMNEFMGIASHELRTPLTSLTANVQLASRQLHGLSQSVESVASSGAASEPESAAMRARLERAEMLLDRTNRQVRRLDRLVDDLLDVSRIHAGKLEMRCERCDLLAIVREAAQEQRAAWPRRHIALELPQRASLLIDADEDRIGQVVTNYLTNALKYSAKDQPVTLRVSVRGTQARVEAHDSGPGLTKEQRGRLFERFYRAPGITQQSGSGVGLGLGLHICKTIVERHSGKVGVRSAPDQGSVFWFTLPLADEPPERPTP
ncbi:MAG TPA: ATP-binding protein [Ktedonobacterales bacterium]|nr:ATP-binding protein [Ktedonobacterales bacterium]